MSEYSLQASLSRGIGGEYGSTDVVMASTNLEESYRRVSAYLGYVARLVYTFDDPALLVAASSEERPITIATMRARVRESDVSERRELARKFAERAREVQGVQDVLLDAVEPDLIVTVRTDDADLSRELTLHAMFVEIVRESEDPSVGELRIRAVGERAVEAAGESLLS